jgi:hypothetical protein
MEAELKSKLKFKKLILIFLILFGIIAPISKVNALCEHFGPLQGACEAVGGVVQGFLSWGGQQVQNFATGIIVSFAQLVGGLGMWFMDWAQGFLNWVVSPDFLGVSMTGSDNPVVTFGWHWMRDLANIILVLGLVFIALGIILGIREYEAKKTLPVLIIIGLLINFTPVICGWLIDLSNSILFFVLPGTGIKGDTASKIHDGFNNAVGSGDNNMEKILASMVYVFFGFLAGIIYLLYALIFVCRYIALWVLVIFSPIAFVSRIFPKGRITAFFPGFLHWDRWWDEFLRWCVIGLFAAFFIRLANVTVDAVLTPNFIKATPPGEIFLYAFPLFMLLIGLFLTVNTVQEMRGSVIIGGIVGGAAMAAKVRKVPGRLREAGRRIRRAPGVRHIAESRYVKRLGEKVKGIPGAIGERSEKLRRAGGWVKRRIPERWRIEYRAKKRREKEKKLTEEMRKIEGMTIEEAEKRAYTDLEKAAVLKKKIGKGKVTTIKDFEKELIDAGIDEEEINEMYSNSKVAKDKIESLAGRLSKDLIEKLKSAYSEDTLKKLKGHLTEKDLEEAIKKRPDLAETLSDGKEKTRDIVEKMSPEDFRKNVQEEALKHIDVLASMSPEKIREIERKGSETQIRILADYIPRDKNDVKRINKLIQKRKELEEEIKKAKTAEEEIKKAKTAGEEAEARERLERYDQSLKRISKSPIFRSRMFQI